MNQQNTGSFLKKLRKEKSLTQEQLAEHLNVSARTVSRWETGNNMPDLSILIEIADFYDVDIRELIDGKRKDETMDKETKDTLKKVADYAELEKKTLSKRMCNMTSGTLLVFCFFLFLRYSELVTGSPYENISEFTLGLTLATLVLNILYFAGALDKIRSMKKDIRKKLK